MDDQYLDNKVKEEDGLYDLIKLFQTYLKFLKGHIFLVLYGTIALAATGFFFAYFSKIKYKAELRFVVKSDGSASGMSGMLGNLGAVLGGNTMGSPLERTVEIVSSDRIVGSVLLADVKFNGKHDILANFLIRTNELYKIWSKDSVLRDVYFSINDTSIEDLEFAKRKAIKKLEDFLIPKTGEGIIAKSYDKKSGIVTLATILTDEDLAIVLAKEIYNKLRDFYIEQMITSASNNVLVLEKKVDSIKFELSRVQSSFARNSDQSYGLLFQEDKVELRKLAVREQILLAMYAEAQKNLETFKFMNDSAIPTLTVIDMPYSPLKKIQRNKFLYTVIGAILGAFLTSIIISIRHWYKNLMAS